MSQITEATFQQSIINVLKGDAQTQTASSAFLLECMKSQPEITVRMYLSLLLLSKDVEVCV